MVALSKIPVSTPGGWESKQNGFEHHGRSEKGRSCDECWNMRKFKTEEGISEPTSYKTSSIRAYACRDLINQESSAFTWFGTSACTSSPIRRKKPSRFPYARPLLNAWMRSSLPFRKSNKNIKYYKNYKPQKQEDCQLPESHTKNSKTSTDRKPTWYSFISRTAKKQQFRLVISF